MKTLQANTLALLKCPDCEGKLASTVSTHVGCLGCKKSYPILGGVLILVPDVRSYLIEHVKGISRQVDAAEIPKEHRAAFTKAKREIAGEHIEEDLEAERVNALYLMNHYMKAAQVRSPSPEIAELVARHWDHGPFEKIANWFAAKKGKRSLIELGCGTGGLFLALNPHLENYLGLDQSFASVALARHLILGAPHRGAMRVPNDLLHGSVSREVKIAAPSGARGRAEFIVCDLAHPPVRLGQWDACAALNVIDMLPEPRALPVLQHGLLRAGGVAIQSSPYVWHSDVAENLREQLPKNINDSAQAVEWLYRECGFKIDSAAAQVPWLFFKHIRQIELYSVHLFFASK